MRPDRDEDWGTKVKSLSQSRVRDRKPELKGMQRAALSASQVTGDEHWDVLLSIIQERVEKLQSQMEVAIELLKNSDNFSPDDLINQKLAVRLIGREIGALRWVTELPKQVMEQGDRAKELLGTIEESSG